jgi:hypothetical protein
MHYVTLWCIWIFVVLHARMRRAICYVHTRAFFLAFSTLVWCMRLKKVMHAIAHALNMLNGVENSNTCRSSSILFCNH